MKIILLQDIENLGKKDEIKRVANGYARNFLFARSLAKPVTKEVLKELEKKREEEARKAEEDLKIMQDLVSQIDGLEIDVPEKTDEEGKLYGSVNEVKISQILKNKGFDIKKKQIKIPQPIKEIGEYPITILFDHGLEAEIKLFITEESKQPQQS